jgi:hypothetical protein
VFLNTRPISVFREGNKEAMTDGWRLRPHADIQALIDRENASLVIFKSINDSQIALQLLKYFDSSRIIWIYRNFNDTANSAVARWGASQRDMVVWIGQAFAKYGSVEKAMPSILRKPSFAVYAERISPESIERLVEWTSVPVSEHTGAAIMWYLRNQLYFEQDLNTNARSLLVNYENLVRHPDEQLRRMCEFMGTRHLKSRARSIFSTSIEKDELPDISPRVLSACKGLLDDLNRVEQSVQLRQS